MFLSMFGATLDGVKTLLGRRDPVAKKCKNGHTLLKNWKECPDCKIYEHLDEISKNDTKRPWAWLYCYKGPHCGEVHKLTGNIESIGIGPLYSIVLTPIKKNTVSNYEILYNELITISSPNGSIFKLNGKDLREEELIDYDQLEILDNHFLVMKNPFYDHLGEKI